MTVSIGQKGLSFKKLKGVDGKSYSLEDFKSSKALVVIFSCNHCPYVIAYEDRYIALQRDYEAKGVKIIAINSNDPVRYPEDSYENMVKRAKEKKYNFPYLWDQDQTAARDFGATNTPHVFVLDQARALRYTGRIDDNWENPKRVSAQDARRALDDLLEGEEPSVTSTLPVGCSIKWK